METSKKYSFIEELWHSISHGIGLLLSVSALTLLTVFAAQSGDGAKIASAIVFGLSLMMMYGASTLYHAVSLPSLKAIFRRADHCAIYILIAGTYTPVSLLGIKGAFGWALFGVAWGIALVGILLKLFFPKRFHALAITLYALMGWMVVIAIKPLTENLATLPLTFLVIGGLIYSVGIVFYVWKKLSYHHAIWHFFVLAGSVFHFFVVLLLILEEN